MAAPVRTPPAPKAPAQIGACHADFDVAALRGPLSTPEALLAAVRQEILPALSEVLDDPDWQDVQIEAPLIEIDLGAWPDDPVWSDVRYVLVLKLRQALAAYSQAGRTALNRANQAQQRQTANTDTTPVSEAASALPDTIVPPAAQANSTSGQQPQQHPSAATMPAQPSVAGQGQKAHDPSASGAGRDPSTLLTDPGPTAELKAFSSWLEASQQPRSAAIILAHLAERPALQAALLIWHASETEAQKAALSLSPTQWQNVVTVTARLAEQSLSPTATKAPLTDKQRPDKGTDGKYPGSDQVSADITDGTDRGAFDPALAESVRAALTQLRQTLSSESSPQADNLRAVTHRLSTLMLQSGASADAAREHSLLLVARLLARPETAHAVHASAAKYLSNSNVIPAPEPTTTATNEAGQAKTPFSVRNIRNPGEPDTSTQLAETKNPHPSDDPKTSDEGSESKPSNGDAARAPFEVDPHTQAPALLSALMELAKRLKPGDAELPRTAIALKEHLRHAFTRDPSATFEAAQSLGHLSTLSGLLNGSKTERTVLFGPEALSARQIKTLNAANPATLPAVLKRMAPADMLSLSKKMLPEQARLLRDQIETLHQDAVHPETALRQVVLAILDDTPLDIEALRELTPAQQPPDAPTNAAKAVDGAHDLSLPHVPTNQRTENPAAVPATTATPLLALLALSGLSEPEIARVTDPDAHGSASEGAQTPNIQHPENQTRQPGSNSAAADVSGSENQSQNAVSRSDAALRDHLVTLATATAPADATLLPDVLALLWSVWPHRQNAPVPQARIPTPNAQPAQQADAPADSFPLLRAQLAAQATPNDGSLAAAMAEAVPLLETDAERRLYALRIALARLSGLAGPDATGLRAMTRAALQTLLEPPDAAHTQPPARPSKPLQSDSSAFADTTPGEDTLLVTETAGLVLLHPFYALLFDRLKIARAGKALHADDLPRALGTLQFLAGEPTRNDPLHRVLLGLDATHPLPEADPPDEDASTLMDGLLRSVIERWGRLGATSPDGLRQTFIRRTGTLRFDETGARLRVTTGAFDMLLDGLPWSLSPVALPWMPLPCAVIWREDQDA